MRRARHLAALCALVLSGCATVPPQAPPQDWNVIKLQRQALENWRISGRAAVTAGNEGWSASLEWQQQDSQSRLRLYGPFGAGALRVTTDGESLDIQTAKGEALSGEDAKAVLEQTLGTELPLAPLRYWLLGVPEPRSSGLVQLDGQGRLTQLNQHHWQVTYQRYEQVEGQWLPSLISAVQGDVKVRVVVSRWQLPR